jgi:vacuolar-type H+-ATPase subunit H
MTTPSISIASPLDEIRQVEAEVARQLQAARAEAEAHIVQAEESARAMKQQSLEAGRHEGEADYQEFITRASRDAEQIIQDASLAANTLRQSQAQHLASLVRRIVECVTAVEARWIPYEPENAVSADHWPKG